MQNIMTAQVLGGRRFDINGTKMAQLHLAIPSDSDNDDMVGLEVMKANCPYQLLDSLKSEVFPAEFELSVRMKTAAGGKVGIEVLSMSKIDKKTGEVITPGKKV